MKTTRTLLTGIALSTVLTGCATKPSTNYGKPQGADLYVKAMNELDRGNDDAAIADLNAAIDANPSLRMARMKLGELYLTKKDYDRAVPHLQAASDLDPYTRQNHYNLGVALQVMNRLQESAIAYIRALRVEPDDFGSNMNLGLVYFALGQLDPAVYYIEKSTRLSPESARAWSNLGVVYDAAGNLILAEASYRKGMELDPDSESTLINLTSNLIGQRKSTDAVAVARQLVEIQDTPISYKRLGDAYAVGGKWTDAIGAYDSALAKDRKFVPALNAKAELFVAHYEADLRIDDSLRQSAMALWTQSLQFRPEQPAVKSAIDRWSDPKVFK